MCSIGPFPARVFTYSHAGHQCLLHRDEEQDHLTEPRQADTQTPFTDKTVQEKREEKQAFV